MDLTTDQEPESTSFNATDEASRSISDAQEPPVDVAPEDDKLPKKSIAINATLFLIGTIAFSVTSHFIPAKNFEGALRSTFDPGCTDGLDTQMQQRFSLDMNFGNFTFAQAKLIDVIWDTTVGQGGRLFHGWILYTCVIYKLLVFAMEQSTMSYDYYISLSFAQTSFETIWVALKTFGSLRSASLMVYTIMLIYALIYTLCFSFIWSTATGYLSLSHRLYAMPDSETVPLNTDDLRICWVLDSARLGMSGDYVELGPSFATIGTSQKDSYNGYPQLNFNESHFPRSLGVIRWTSGGWKYVERETIWDHFNESQIQNNSEDFENIRAYALSAQLLQISLNPSQWILNGPGANLSTPVTNTTSQELDWWQQNNTDISNLPNLYTHINAFQYITPSQRHSSNLTQTVESPLYDDAKLDQGYWTTFELNQTDGVGPGKVPYNSTIWLNGKAFELPAPFLDVGHNCAGNTKFSSLGNCVCYKGRPINDDLLKEDRAICDTAPGYVWGFSSYLTRIGLALEAAWMGCCFFTYLSLSTRSKLLRRTQIRTAGRWCLALGVTESIRNDIGEKESVCLHEKEVERRLNDLKITYKAEQDEAGRTLRYRIASDGKGKRKMGSISDRMNSHADDVWGSMKAYWVDRYGKAHRPTEHEVYEDLNADIYE